ncbi:uncharacterized protein LOC111248958 [Varroa destructor]|uniref:Uncharacterized protein n=1 Tax=Varroa destructor TaxID=109461 RepID=A0A7M7JYG8_VARDE|nr:uncharacterized protein LOC111248958 [Varroa destructor]
MNRIQYHGGGRPDGRARREHWIHRRLQEIISRQQEQSRLGDYLPFEAQLNPKNSQLIRKLIYTDKSTGGTRWKEFDAPDNISDEEASTIETSPFSLMNTETMILGGAFQSQWNFQTRSVPLTRIVEGDVSIGSNLQTVGPNRQDNGETCGNSRPSFASLDERSYSPTFPGSNTLDHELDQSNATWLEGDPCERAGISVDLSTHCPLSSPPVSAFNIDRADIFNTWPQQVLNKESNQGNHVFLSLPTTST